MIKLRSLFVLLALSLMAACGQNSAEKNDTQTATSDTDNTEVSANETPAAQPKSSEVNLYSARKEALIKPLLDQFTADTGIKVNLVSSKADALLKRIESEGANSPADVLLTTDAGRLHRAEVAGVFSPIESAVLTESIPENYRNANNLWFGLSVRARTIMVTEDGKKFDLKTYEDLAKPELKGQICIRSSSNIYNQSLMASIIDAAGVEAAEQWANGVKDNMARPPQGGDRDQIRAAAAGQCSVVVANTYYLGAMTGDASNTADQEAAAALSVVWPNQDSRGAHVNVSGAGVLKNAPNRDNAIRLIEFLASDKAQKIYANVNFEYPVKSGIEVNEVLTNWGDYKADTLNLDRLGANNAEAVKAMDRAGWK